ncbi:MAG: NAD(P)H-dependent oxidoreductase [DPANN group archaeon]|nr:NAD(P)H-dependent oxidoreductase [DPANN group archaeon]
MGHKIVIINGSPRNGSATSKVVKFILQVLEELKADYYLIDFENIQLPQFNDRQEPAEVANLHKKVNAAGGFIICTPEYHGSVSGALKNFLDYCSIEDFEGKPAAMVSVASGHGIYALTSLQMIMRNLHAWTLPLSVAVGHVESKFSGDNLTDKKIAGRLQLICKELIRFAEIFGENKFTHY